MLKLAKSIKMVITDFDGIITDNCIYIDDFGKTSRKLNFKDIMAFSLLKKNNYKIGIISGETNSAIDFLANKFGIDEVHQGIRNKLEVLNSIIDKYNLDLDEYIYIGDDINDFDSLVNTKYAITVPTAINQIKAISDIQITRNNPGNGAFREIVDALLQTNNK